MGENDTRRKNAGATLIETLLALFFIGIAIIAFGALTQYMRVNTHVKLKAAAYNLAAEEMEAVRTLGFSAIENRNDVSSTGFMNLAIPFGDWQVLPTASAPSAPNAYEVSGRTASATGLTGLAPLPSPTGFATQFSAYTVEARIAVQADSPRPDWEAGVAFRYQDEQTRYRYLLRDDGVAFTRSVMGTDGVITTATLYNGTPVVDAGTWYTLRVRITDDASDNVQLSLNGVVLYTGTESGIVSGELGLVALNSAHVLFDDVRVATDTSNIPPVEPTWDTTWNFDTGETPGNQAVGWSRFGLNDLPDATRDIANDNGELTITNYSGNPDIKNVTVTVTYDTSTGSKNITLHTLISRYGTTK